MSPQFAKHYSREEAQALLPAVRRWLGRLKQLRRYLEKQDQQLARLLAAGNDLGGEGVNAWIRLLADLKGVLDEFQQRDIQVKDLERGLVDFPAMIAGKEVFLCWEEGEETIEYWHDLDTGYTGRTPL